MSFVTTQPEMLSFAAGDLQSIGSAMAAGNTAAAAPTTGVVPAAADEVSALTAAQFAAHGPAVPGDRAPKPPRFMNYLSAPWGPAPVRTRPPRPPTPQRSAEPQRFQ